MSNTETTEHTMTASEIAVAALIGNLKAATAARAEIMGRGEWTREEMEKANALISRIADEISSLRG